MSALADFRTGVAGALTELNEEWTVLAGPVDAIEPPAFMLVWADPWLARATFCNYTATLDVLVVAGRIEPESDVELMETMTEAALGALLAVGAPVLQVGTPGPLELGGVRYLAARITMLHPLTFGGS